MKKLVCLLLAMVLALSSLACAAAEDWIRVGSGKHSVLVLVKVLDKYVYGYQLLSNEANLLDALEGIGLVQGGMTSQGYVIDKVDGFKGMPEENGAYWTLQTYNDEHDQFQLPQKDISDIGTADYTAIALVRNTDDVPYEEKLIYMVVDPGDDDIMAFEILTEDQDTVLECLLDNGLVDGEQASWGFNVTEAAGVRADYDRDGSYWNILEFDPSADEFVYMDEALANVHIDDLPSVPEMAGYAFILSK